MNEVLYTPWRMSYLVGNLPPISGCLFCTLPGHPDEDALIVHRGTTCYVLLNRFPYTNGHLMVTTYAHHALLSELSPAELAEMFDLAVACEITLRKVYSPHGLNLGINVGKSAGAGIADHIHLHVVPRWDGDTNFLSVTAGTRTVPEELPATRERLKSSFVLAGRV